MRILNHHSNDTTALAFFIGRKPGAKFHWGNPFSHLSHSKGTVIVATRDDAVDRFRSWLRKESDLEVEPERRDWILANLERLRGKDLLCYCAPHRCHAEVYIEMLGETVDGR